MDDNELETTLKLKLIFLGDQGTGKSSILNRYINNTFEEEYQATVGLDFQSKNITIGENETDVRLLLYDTAGQEKFKSLIPMYIRDSNIVLFVYDITRPDSFESVPKLFSEVLNIQTNEAVYMLVGNKIDLESERKVTYEQGKKFADEKNLIFEEVSAKTGKNIVGLFDEKLHEIISSKLKQKRTQMEVKVEKNAYVKIESPQENNDEKQKKKKGGCC